MRCQMLLPKGRAVGAAPLEVAPLQRLVNRNNQEKIIKLVRGLK